MGDTEEVVGQEGITNFILAVKHGVVLPERISSFLSQHRSK